MNNLLLKLALLLFMLFFIGSVVGFSQAERDWIIKISPVKIFRGDLLTKSLSLGLSLEKKINNKWSVEQYVGFITDTKYSLFKNFNSFYSPFFRRRDFGAIVNDIKGIRLDSKARYYFQENKSSPYGLSIGGKALFVNTISIADFYDNDQSLTGEINRTLVATYVELGGQLVDNKWLVSVDFYFGPRFISSSNSLNNTSYSGNDYGGKNYAFGSGFSVGYGLDLSFGFAIK